MFNRPLHWLAHPAQRRGMFILLASAALSLWSAAARADEWCVLKLKDGRTLSGILVMKNDGGITLRPEGGENIAFANAEIVESSFQKSPREEYAEKRALVKDDDLSGRYTLLLTFYYANQKSASAKAFCKDEAEQLLKDFPDSASIQKLHRAVSQAAEKPDAAAVAPDAGTGGTATQIPDPGTPAAAVVPLMSANDQNLLRLYQFDFKKDAKLSLTIPKDVVDDLFKSKGDSEELKKYKVAGGPLKFRNLRPVEQLEVIFDLRERELYPKIKVGGEPASLLTFRTDIHAMLIGYFTQRFAAQVPGLIAKPKNISSPAEAYTNFLALSLASVDGHAVIDHQSPADSLLLQWGLPRDLAKYPAPEIKGWKPYFTGTNDSRFIEISRWIKSTYEMPADSMSLPSAEKPKESGQKPGPASPATPQQPNPRRQPGQSGHLNQPGPGSPLPGNP